MNRRSFLSTTALVAGAAFAAPSLLTREPVALLPIEVFNPDTWLFEPLVGGLRNIKCGQVFRAVYAGRHITFPNGDADSSVVDGGEQAWYGLATEDGGTMLDRNGDPCGHVGCVVYGTDDVFKKAVKHA